MDAGYVTPPGGPEPPWGHCLNWLFFFFVCLNGFALVFAMAAIVCATLGPLILMLREDRMWRKQIVNVGLGHLVVSLLSLLAAFTLAGCILAGLDARPCDTVRCSEGGIPCSLFTLVNKTDTSVQRQPLWVPRRLAPELVRLNVGTFGNVAHDAVTCQDYSYVASFPGVARHYPKHVLAEAWGTLVEGDKAQDAAQNVVKQPCLAVLSESVFSNQSLVPNTYRSASMGHEDTIPNPYGMWCTTNSPPVDLGWLPLKLQHAAQLTGLGLPELTAGHPLNGSGYTVEGADPCPHSAAYDKIANAMLPNGIPAVPLLAGVDNPWRDNGFVNVSQLDNNQVHLIVCTYAAHMGYNMKGALRCHDSAGRFAGQTLGPLASAHYMPALMYQCSAIQNGVLCDFATDPPLAVDGSGQHLTYKRLTELGGFYDAKYYNSPKDTLIYPAVIAMGAVAVFANLGTLVYFACKPVERGRSYT